MAALLELSHELLHCIFSEVDPADLAPLSQTCRLLHSYIKGNRLLHKDLYALRYDEPSSSIEPDWEEEIHKAVRLERLLQSEDREVKRENIGFVSRQINSLLDTARIDPDDSLNVQILREYFEDQNNVDVFLCSSSLFERGGTRLQQPAPTPELRQASAKLHCLYGKPVDPVPSKRCSSSYALAAFFTLRNIDVSSSPSQNTRARTGELPAHTVARSRVYDLREYTLPSLWGPFMADGSQDVDWEKVEAIMMVLGFNLSRFNERSDGRFPIWDQSFEGATPYSYVSLPSPNGPAKEIDEEIGEIRSLQPSIDDLDPYGVTGTWMRVVCFLDYNDLYAFNFANPSHPEDQPREPIDTQEGIIDLEETLQVTRVDPPGSDESEEDADRMDWSNFKGQRLPIVHFRGSSRSLHASWDPNANSRIRGSVRQTPEGEIRWTTFSIFHGEERWRSEGIQVGGLKSARGVLGNWFDKDFDQHGPAGPTAFWKITDELAEEKTNSMPVAYF